ncbi:Asparagine synthetase domain-containing protein 1 [Eufriesea mexicana]|uniref:Asparagine synthetase domain-containing protein 1 n=1 Tax=Eufriesea mexicana TaxID=516756 RepID=A0A310SFG4_9HYME|nr:Asparagine synthetase domain-containing protein 1 [Eufriesea mexicana]
MCGIFCCVSQNHKSSIKISHEWEVCKNLVSARGPDGIQEKFENLTPNWFGHFVASVLWMQGSNLSEQPLIDSNGNILLWNGDIFSGKLAQDNMCDTNVLLNALQSSSNILTVFQEIQGPYSFIYFQKSSSLLYFGRDIIGRHSLLIKINTDKNVLTLTSVASKEINKIIEIPAVGIFVMNLANLRVNLACYPWKELDLQFTDIIETLETHLGVDIDIKQTILKPATSIFLHLHPSVKDIEYLESSSYLENSCKVLEYLLENKDIHERVDHLLQLLYKAVEVRIIKQPKFCKTCIKLVLNKENVECNHSKIGILFSGGLDSAILTLIADKYVSQHEPIDLINVAFEKSINTSKKSNAHNAKRDMEDKYDVNVSQTELQKYRSSRICNLLYPLCTVLDESLGCAVWFASRAKGMGADELFGGYMRHRTILKHKGWDALMQELNIELDRISERNLGRDDRIVSDHGRQSRLPYLDENVLEYVQKLKPWERCYPTDKMPSGLGDKLLLRLAAYKLGFRNTANFPKRAFQFGSRIANSRENAKSISGRL